MSRRVEIVLVVLISAAVSAFTTNILATYYFKIVDGYVEDICKQTKNFVESVRGKEGGE